jgi:probable HAF family extracellular repeat protein
MLALIGSCPRSRGIAQRILGVLVACAAALSAVAGPAAGAAPSAPTYEVIDFSAFSPDASCSEGWIREGGSSANAVTESGYIVGDQRYYSCDFTRQGFLLTPAPLGGWSFQALPRYTPEWGFGWDADAVDVNESGTAVGWSDNQATSGQRPVAWVNGELRELGRFGLPLGWDPVYTEIGSAFGISNDGTVVGSSITASATYHPFRSDGTNMVDLGVPDGYAHAEAVAVSEQGAIAMNAFNGDVSYPGGWVGISRDAFVLRGRRVLPLGDLGGGSATATDISDAGGAVVGWSRTAATEEHAFLWKGNSMRDLGPGRALGVNDSGDVVGATRDLGSYTGGFLYRKGKRYSLTELVEGDGWTVIDARGINNRGEIVGTASRPGASGLQAVLLTPAD